MPKKPRPKKFLLCLSQEEWELVKSMAQEEGITRSDLIRCKTIYRRLPRRVTTIAAQTYWQLAQIANHLNQLTFAANTALKRGQPPPVDTDLLAELKLCLTQVRKELVELDLLAQLDEQEDEQDDWQANQR